MHCCDTQLCTGLPVDTFDYYTRSGGGGGDREKGKVLLTFLDPVNDAGSGSAAGERDDGEKGKVVF